MQSQSPVAVGGAPQSWRAAKSQTCSGLVKGQGFLPCPEGNPASSKRQRMAPSATALYLTAQEHMEACQNGALLLTINQPNAANIPAEMTPIHVNVSEIQLVYYCQAEGCCEGSSTSHSTICAHVNCDNLGTKLSCPLCSTTFYANALKQHGKWTHHTMFACPNWHWNCTILFWNVINTLTISCTYHNLFTFSSYKTNILV